MSSGCPGMSHLFILLTGIKSADSDIEVANRCSPLTRPAMFDREGHGHEPGTRRQRRDCVGWRNLLLLASLLTELLLGKQKKYKTSRPNNKSF